MIAVNLMVMCDEPAEVAATMEVLGRAGAGVALEGRTVTVTIVTVEDD